MQSLLIIGKMGLAETLISCKYCPLKIIGQITGDIQMQQNHKNSERHLRALYVHMKEIQTIFNERSIKSRETTITLSIFFMQLRTWIT